MNRPRSIIAACLLVIFSMHLPRISAAAEAQYSYDDLGRLITVVDEADNMAIYNYNTVGNLLGIDRFTPGVSGIAIYTLGPGNGAIGNQVTMRVGLQHYTGE